MRRFVLGCLVTLWVVVPAIAQDEKVVRETWDAAYFNGAKAGYYHTVVREAQQAGAKVLVTSFDMDVKVRRYDKVVPLRMGTSTTETPEGKVLGLGMTHFLDRGQLKQSARVSEGKLLLSTPGMPGERVLPWDDRAMGLAAQDRLFQDREVKAGDRFTYHNFDLALFKLVTLNVTVKEAEDIDVFETKRQGDRVVVERVSRKLLRVEVQPGKVRVGENEIPLPLQILWLDKDRQVVRQQTELPGLGRLTLFRTTEAVAKLEGTAPALLPDLVSNAMIALNRTVDDPHSKGKIVYRITYRGDDDPTTLFTRDKRQSVEKVGDNLVDLTVQAVRKPDAKPNSEQPDKKYLESSYFLDSANPKIRAFTEKAVDDAATSWEKAQRIEAWVHANMRHGDVQFATAGQVAERLQGDCRQHAMLTAAMCRSAKLPSRTALGLVYGHDGTRGPKLVFHMWTEVWVDGQWISIDAVTGKGSVGPAHLKILDHSWHDTQSLAPLLGASRVLGKVDVEIRSVE